MSKRLRSTTQNHNHDDDHDDTPFDIQTEIIKRIQDVKSLMRCRSVSKPCKSLIDSSKFIADHYKSNTNNNHIMIKFLKKKGHNYRVCVDDDRFPHNNLPVALPDSIRTSQWYCRRHTNLIGTSHGLFCFHGREEKVVDNSSFGNKKAHHDVAVIWNPSIRKSVTIPFPDKHHDSLAAINFGVCPRTMHPKLVCIRPAEKLADMYTLSSSSGANYWTSVSINLPNISQISFAIGRAAHKAAVDDGILYWHVYTTNFDVHDHIRLDNRIITFDLASEEFGEVCLPHTLATTDCQTELYISSKPNESSLVVIARPLYQVFKVVSHVWRMEEHGLFKKLYTIEAPFAYIVRGFRMNGQALIEREIPRANKSLVQVYDPSNRQIKDNDFNHIGHEHFSVTGCYTETLLLLNHQSISSFIGDRL